MSRERVPRPDDIVLGQPLAPYPHRVVRLTPRDQAFHATIWGRTGSGKSRFLQAIFLQLLSKGRCVCLIEPHHDLSFDTLAYLVERGYFRQSDAFDRLIYLDWGNGAVVPFNVLHSTRSPPKSAALQALEAMIRVWPELRRAPTFQTLFLASMVTLAQNRLPITALHRLLSDAPFRDACLRQVRDPLILQTFAPFTANRSHAQEAGSALRRAFLLAFDDVTRLSLGQPDTALDIRSLMDQGRSLIVNLGNIPDAETRRLIGALLLVQIEQAALSRTDLSPDRRRSWTVLLDEWPSFAATDAAVGTILEQTRKFGLRLYLAAQSTGQVGSDRLQAALENCRLSVTFGLGRESAIDQSRQLVTLDPELYHPDPITGRPRHISSSEQFERATQDLQHLSPQEAYVKIHTDPPVKVRTLAVKDPHPNSAELAQVLAAYRARYQRSRREAETRVPRLDSPPVAGSLAPPFTLFATGRDAGISIDDTV